VVLDRIHWDSDTFAVKRDENISKHMTLKASFGDEWIIEGVYGFLAEVALPRATGLVWLNLPWKDCERGILERGAWQNAEPDAMESLLKWARDYSIRQTSSSLAGHKTLFDNFAGPKLEIKARQDVDALIVI